MGDFVLNAVLWTLALYGLFEIVKTILYIWSYTNLKSDGIYARVEWTKRGKSYVLNKEYRYLSPVVEIRKEDGKVTKLHSVALTNAPAIHGMTPIINSIYSRQDEREEEELDLDTKHILKMLNVSEDDFKRYRREEKE